MGTLGTIRATIYIILAILLAVTLVGGYLFVEQSKNIANNNSPDVVSIEQDGLNNNSVSSLYVEREGNTFLLADNLLRQGRSHHSSARALFEEAQNTALSPEQAAHISYKAALTYTFEDTVEMIRRMKEIVANPEYPNPQKAFALQHIYLTYAHLVPDKALLSEIFAGDPYTSFVDDESISLSLRRFNEHTVGFGDAPLSALGIAKWYSFRMRNDAVKNDSSQFNEYLTVTEKHLDDAELFVTENQNVRNNQNLIPRVLISRAIVYGNLAIAGVEQYSSDYPDIFETAIEFATEADIDSSVRNAYARTALLIDDAEGFERARPHFDVLIENINTERYTAMKEAYLLIRDEQVAGKEEIVEMANKYEPFKEMLISIGWTEADFI